MPRYLVTWEWSCAWVVEAADAETARECANDPEMIYEARAAADGPEISICSAGRSRRDGPPDAVALDGSLPSPDQESARAEWERLVALEEGKR